MSKGRVTVTKLSLRDLKRAGVPPMHVCGRVSEQYVVPTGSGTESKGTSRARGRPRSPAKR